MKNTTKVWIFLFIVSLAHLFIGYQVGDRAGLLLGFFLAVLFNLSVFFFGEVHLLKFTGARRARSMESDRANRKVFGTYGNHGS
jgi:heat shock protein HtpX